MKWLPVLLVLLWACREAAPPQGEARKGADRRIPAASDPIDKARESFELGMQQSGGASRAAHLRSAAAALREADSAEGLALRARVRAQQGLWQAARVDATAAIAKGDQDSRRLRLQIDHMRLLDHLMILSFRQEFDWLTASLEDSKALGGQEPELAALGIMSAMLTDLSDRIEPYDQNDGMEKIIKALSEAVKKLEGAEDFEAVLLRARLADHLATWQPIPINRHEELRKMAEADLARLGELEPNHAGTHRARLLFQLVRQDSKGAKEEALSYVQFLPDSPYPLLFLAHVHLGAGEKDQAFAAVERAAKFIEQPSDIPIMRARLRMGGYISGFSRSMTAVDAEAALEEMKEALVVDPDDPLVLFEMGYIQLNVLQRFQAGMSSLKKYIEARPGTVIARHARAFLQNLSGPITGVVDARNRFSYARSVTKELKNLEGGKKLYTMLLNRMADDAKGPEKLPHVYRSDLRIKTNYNLACIHSQLGEIDKGLKRFETALKAGLPTALYGFARSDVDLEALRKDPRFEETLKKFEQ